MVELQELSGRAPVARFVLERALPSIPKPDRAFDLGWNVTTPRVGLGGRTLPWLIRGCVFPLLELGKK